MDFYHVVSNIPKHPGLVTSTGKGRMIACSDLRQIIEDSNDMEINYVLIFIQSDFSLYLWPLIR